MEVASMKLMKPFHVVKLGSVKMEEFVFIFLPSTQVKCLLLNIFMYNVARIARYEESIGRFES